mmetsp:Transcript_51927/g.151284  ORF Transcript_51927/g.151284 Transcript_51927/m.151284 type:complete len:88 (-) Transcript_51927:15-278(-)
MVRSWRIGSGPMAHHMWLVGRLVGQCCCRTAAAVRVEAHGRRSSNAALFAHNLAVIAAAALDATRAPRRDAPALESRRRATGSPPPA